MSPFNPHDVATFLWSLTFELSVRREETTVGCRQRDYKNHCWFRVYKVLADVLQR